LEQTEKQEKFKLRENNRMLRDSTEEAKAPSSFSTFYTFYQRLNLTKDVSDLCKENYNPLKKEIEEDYRRWKDLPCS
jgi:hypothetical protein